MENILKKMGLVMTKTEVGLQQVKEYVQSNRRNTDIKQTLRGEEARGRDITWWTSAENEKLTKESLEHICKNFGMQHVHVQDTPEEIRVTHSDEQGNKRDVTHPQCMENEDIMFTTEVNGKIVVTERWVPKVGPQGINKGSQG